MATTVVSIIDAAWERSVKNRSSLAEDDPELVGVLHDVLEGYYDDAARMMSNVFALDSTAIVYAQGGWAVPAGVNRIYGVRKTSGAKVYVLPEHKRYQALGAPAVWREINTLISIAGNPASTDQLRIHYSKRPAPTTYAGSLDLTWPEQYNALLEIRVAQYLAKKSTERDNELAALNADQQEWEARFFAYLAQNTVLDVGLYGRNTPRTVSQQGVK